VAVTLSDAARGRRILSLLDVARGVTARFTTTAKPEYAPIWSPDGNRIAFSCSRSSTDICQRSANGAGAEELLLSTNRPKVPVGWSPDGRFILYIAPGVDDHQVTLWVLPLSGDRKPFPFAEIDTLAGSGQFSRDGRWIAYVSGETGRDEVYIASFPDSGRKTRVSSSGGSYPRWRRDGTETAGLAALLPVALLTVSGYRDDQDVAKIGEAADRAGDIVAVHPRQADIEHDRIRSESTGGGDRVGPS